MSTSQAVIVVGVDGSASAARALDWAIDHAVEERHGLTLVHALGAPPAAWTDIGLADPEPRSPCWRARVDGSSTVPRPGSPNARARWTSRRSWSSPIRVPSWSGSPRAPRSSCSAPAVVDLSRACCSARSARQSPGTRRAPWSSTDPHIVGGCATACWWPPTPARTREPVLEFAYHVASVRRLPLTIMHCHWDVATMGMAEENLRTASLETARLELAESVAGMSEKYPDVSVTTTLVVGAPEARVAQAVERMDLLVVGAHRRSVAGRVIHGSISMSLLEHVHVPVAVVPLDDQRLTRQSPWRRTRAVLSQETGFSTQGRSAIRR